MRIAIVTDYYYPMLGGITEHVHGQARELARRGHEVTVVTGHLLRTPPIADQDARPVRRRGLRRRPPRRRRAALRQRLADDPHRARRASCCSCERLFKRLEVDVVHLHAPYNPSMCAIAPLAIPKGAVGVATYHSVFAPGVLLDVFAPILRRWLGKLDAHVVVSEACIGSLAPYFPFDYRIIPNGIDDRHFSPDAEPLPELREGGKPLILFLGRFDPRNGLPTMLDAFEQVHAEHEGTVRLCVVGDGPLGNVYRRKLPERVAGDVIWAGRVDWSRPRYYASADIHCTPCQRASFGMVLLEAMSSGRPVVASRISGFQLLMEHGKQGLHGEPGRRREPLRAGAAVPARPARRARAHGARGAHHGRHALRLVERRRAARAALRRAAEAQAGREMRKRAVVRRFVGASAVVIARRRRRRRRRRHGARGLGRLGVLRRSSACSSLIWAWASFTPNSPLFGKVVTGRGTNDRVLALTFDDGPVAPSGRRRVLDALRASGARATFFVLGRHAEAAPRARSAGSATRATRSPRTATTTRC